MADSFWQLKQNLTKDNVKSAQKAVDYLQNDMLDHMKCVLTASLKEWCKRGFKPLYENPTRILIERSAKTYKEAPKRAVLLNEAVSESMTVTYNDLLATTNLNFISQDLDARARLLTSSILLPQVAKDDAKTITLTVLSRNNCDIKFDPTTRKPVGLIYTAGNTGKNDGKMFHFWTNDEIVDIEGQEVVGREPNPYGFIPIAILNDTRPPLGDLWRYPSWDQLIQLSDGVNLFNTEALYNARYSMVGSPVTNMTIPDGTVSGIDTPLQLDSDGPEIPFFEYRSPTVQVQQFADWLYKLKEAVADEWGVNLKFAGGSIADSGFKLVVEEFENIELRQRRIVAAKQFEEDLYQVFAGMSAVEGWNLDPNAKAVADFKEPALPVNKQNEWLIAKEQIALGVLTIEDYWLQQDPDLTPEQIAERKRKSDAARGLAGTVPNFEVN